MENTKKGIGCCDRSLFSFFHKEKLPYKQIIQSDMLPSR